MACWATSCSANQWRASSLQGKTYGEQHCDITTNNIHSVITKEALQRSHKSLCDHICLHHGGLLPNWLLAATTTAKLKESWWKWSFSFLSKIHKMWANSLNHFTSGLSEKNFPNYTTHITNKAHQNLRVTLVLRTLKLHSHCIIFHVIISWIYVIISYLSQWAWLQLLRETSQLLWRTLRFKII